MGEVLNMMVMEVSNNKKELPGGKHIHRIFFVDENGERYQGEIISLIPTQEDFQKGKKVKFKVDKVGAYIDEIKPVFTYERNEPIPEPLENYPGFPNQYIEDLKHANSDKGNKPVAAIDKYILRPAAGEAITFAVAYAKDILCAEIAAGKKYSEKVMLKRLNMLSNGMYEMMAEKLKM